VDVRRFIDQVRLIEEKFAAVHTQDNGHGNSKTKRIKIL
jgi:hypothetical protein